MPKRLRTAALKDVIHAAGEIERKPCKGHLPCVPISITVWIQAPEPKRGRGHQKSYEFKGSGSF